MKSLDTIKNERNLTILADVKASVLELFGDKLARLILYGSHARGEQGPESDIDIMILVDESESALRRYNDRIADIMTGLSLKHDAFISLTDEVNSRYHEYRDVLPYFRNIHTEGIEIYGRAAV